MRTPLGNMIEMDDSGSGRISIENIAGNFLEMGALNTVMKVLGELYLNAEASIQQHAEVDWKAIGDVNAQLGAVGGNVDLVAGANIARSAGAATTEVAATSIGRTAGTTITDAAGTAMALTAVTALTAGADNVAVTATTSASIASASVLLGVIATTFGVMLDTMIVKYNTHTHGGAVPLAPFLMVAGVDSSVTVRASV